MAEIDSANVYKDVLLAVFRVVGPMLVLWLTIRFGKGLWNRRKTMARYLADLLALSLLQFATMQLFLLYTSGEYRSSIRLGFLGLAGMQWLLYLCSTLAGRRKFAVEGIACLLCTIGMSVVATVCPWEAPKQMMAMVIGCFLYLLLGCLMNSVEPTATFRAFLGGAGLFLLLVTLLLGQVQFGAKNWLVVGGLSIQPSEPVKILLVLVGASGVEGRASRKEKWLFMLYSMSLCALLAAMNDLGTAMVFYVASLFFALLYFGWVAPLFGVLQLAVAGRVAFSIAPHSLQRLLAWRHIWEDPLGSGYQQTRAIMCLSSGGLLGLGVGQGGMKRIFSGDSDVVFATVCEQWGLLVGLACVGCIVMLVVFALGARGDTFPGVAACGAAGILLLQSMLNVLGTVDVLPLTGITFPFLSNGGSALVGAWGLLALIRGNENRGTEDG